MPSSTALSPFDLPRLRRGFETSHRRCAAVGRELVGLYWDIGQAIREQQTRRVWGEAVVDRLARDLKASLAKTAGSSAASLWRMRQFHETYTTPEFLAQLVREGGRDTPRPPGIPGAGGRQPVRTPTGCARNGRGRAMGPPCQPAGRL
ncbi:DUF1016 N-terminal domain-containing protein [Variovorax paradoxus]|uniref:DUF1016 N-terminal domain-containing protein n=1 Tax=Variovorax paradoxus TaxID=34073 RepID=UPI003F4FCC9B